LEIKKFKIFWGRGHCPLPRLFVQQVGASHPLGAFGPRRGPHFKIAYAATVRGAQLRGQKGGSSKPEGLRAVVVFRGGDNKPPPHQLRVWGTL